MKRTLVLLTVALFLGAAGAGQAATGGPFGSWLVLAGNHTGASDPGHGYVEIAHNAALNPTGAITIEMWVKLESPQDGCQSLFGKDFTQAYWIGVCGSTLRAYLKGSGSLKDSGTIPDNEWTHIAIVFNGTQQIHYINGVQVGAFPLTGPLTTSPDPVRIGSDVSWPFSPEGAIDEVRLWSVARTAAQIQAGMNSPITTAQSGLVAVWSLDGTGEDVIGGYDGSLHGNFDFDTVPAPPAGEWLTTSELPGFRFKVRIGGSLLGAKVNDCIAETLCVSGAVPGRAEVFVRVVGPRPNGFLWPILVKFTTSRVEVWIEQLSTGQINYYELAGATPDSSELPGFFDRTGFHP